MTPTRFVRRWPRSGLPFALALAALAGLLAGCGYGQDVPHLPAGAESIALRSVQNGTDTGELDVRLRAALLERLHKRAHVRLLPPERSTLALEVELTELTIYRVLDPAITSDRSFVYSLTGVMSLIDQRTGHRLVNNAVISARVSRLYAPDVRETPAIRDEGLNDVLASFADQVERRVFLTF